MKEDRCTQTGTADAPRPDSLLEGPLGPSATRRGIERLALSLDETAEALGLSRRKLQQLIAAKELPVTRIGRRVVVPVDALRKWLADRAEGGE